MISDLCLVFVYGDNFIEVYVSDFMLDWFIDVDMLVIVVNLLGLSFELWMVLLMGVMGFFGWYLVFELLWRLDVDGRLICLVWVEFDEDVWCCLEKIFDSGDLELLWYFKEFVVDWLEVVVGDKSEFDLGLD